MRHSYCFLRRQDSLFMVSVEQNDPGRWNRFGISLQKIDNFELPQSKLRFGVTKSFFILWISFLLIGCAGNDETPQERSFRMGFQNSAPRVDFDLIQQSLAIWTQRADAAMITTEVPWDDLLAGVSAQKYVADNFEGLVEFYRSKNFRLWVYIDPVNGLNRAADANALVKRGKSIADADTQILYKRFVIVMDSMLRPDHLGLALETNLIKILSPSDIYQGVKKVTTEVAAEIKARGSKAKVSISVQAEAAWGKFTNQDYVGIGQDMADFPFSEEIGISSYPYLFYKSPSDIPHDYYLRLVDGRNLPCFVTEGGWTSQSLMGPSNTTITGDPETQRMYILRQELLLHFAQGTGLFQLTFTDIDVASLPSSVDPTIKYFAYLGLVDVQLQSRPALTAWDEVFKKMLTSGN
jgi:hypothetical protein